MRKVILSIVAALALPATVQAREAAPVEAAAPARFIELQGGRNFRDIGGYRTADGRTVRWGRLYRSGSLGDLTRAGRQRLAALHVTSIVDLRTTEERARDPGNWLATSGQGHWARDYGFSRSDMAAMFGKPETLTVEGMRTMMTGAYRRLAHEQAPGYRVMFQRLVAGKGPVVVNCTAGKDRTGVGVALVLTAIGVPYETVREDFLLSNGAPGMDGLHQSLSGPLARLPAHLVGPIVGVDGVYLDTAFAAIRESHGSVDAFLRDELGVGPREVAMLRKRLLR